MLKQKSEEDSSDDYNMGYLIKIFQKIVRKNKGFKKGANVPRTGHFIRECPLLKAKNKEYQKPRGD